MKTTTKERTLSIAEGAVMVALAVVLDLLPLPSWPQGGSISVAAVPIIFYSYRRGLLMGSLAGLLVADPAHYRAVVHAARQNHRRRHPLRSA